MDKTKILGCFNSFGALLILPLFLLIVAGFVSFITSGESLKPAFFDPWFLIFFTSIVFFFFSNIWLAVNYLTGSRKISLKFGVLDFNCGFWFIILISGYILPVPLLLIFALGTTGSLIYIFRKDIGILLIPLAFTALIVSAFTFIVNYKEDYCQRIGSRVQNSSKEIWLPVNEEEKKEGYGETINAGWRAGRECHKNFNGLAALKDDFISFLSSIPNSP